MSKYPTDRLYSNEHEWIRAEDDDIAVIGITEFAQEELGDVVFVEVPQVGETFGAGDEIGTIESVKAVAELYTPVSGEVVEVNADLEDRPELVNEEPHDGGWLIHLRMSDRGELDSLLDAEGYSEFIASEES
ncbi:MAG: glycine cleavage system protein GcvH [Thermoanaerobaculia bacterium]|nr:glycine cleavage system protein GcvH [Thermoanaerobaculia bacterium]